MCDEARIERELAVIVREIGEIRDCGAWARIITRDVQQIGAARLADLTVARLLQVITNVEQVMGGSDGPGGTLEMQRAH